MDKATMEAIIEQFGERINCIMLDNTRHIFCDYKSESTCRIAELRCETIGTCDFLVVKHYDAAGDGRPITFEMYYPTDTVQGIAIIDEKDVDWRIDPIKLK